MRVFRKAIEGAVVTFMIVCALSVIGGLLLFVGQTVIKAGMEFLHALSQSGLLWVAWLILAICCLGGLIGALNAMLEGTGAAPPDQTVE